MFSHAVNLPFQWYSPCLTLENIKKHKLPHRLWHSCGPPLFFTELTSLPSLFFSCPFPPWLPDNLLTTFTITTVQTAHCLQITVCSWLSLTFPKLKKKQKQNISSNQNKSLVSRSSHHYVGIAPLWLRGQKHGVPGHKVGRKESQATRWESSLQLSNCCSCHVGTTTAQNKLNPLFSVLVSRQRSLFTPNEIFLDEYFRECPHFCFIL